MRILNDRELRTEDEDIEYKLDEKKRIIFGQENMEWLVQLR